MGYFKRYRKRPLWCKIRAILLQVLVPLIIFQAIRTFFLPTTFDIVLVTLMIVFYFSLRLGLI